MHRRRASPFAPADTDGEVLSHGWHPASFTDALHKAALGDGREAVRVAWEAFPGFHVAPAGIVHGIRDGSGFEGWIVAGDAP